MTVKNKQMFLNIVMQLLSYAVTMSISFFLTPYIVNLLGSSTYGYVTLANNFVSYAQIITIALNSMAGRFITVALNKQDKDTVNKYITSVIATNVLLAVIFAVLGSVIVIFLDKLFDLTNVNVIDIRLLWIFIFLNFVISLAGSTFSVATYTKNRMDLSARKNIESYLIRASLLLMAYMLFEVKVWYIGAISVVCTVYLLIWNIYYYKKFLPQVEIKKIYYDIKLVIEIISSGIWNTITRLGSTLSTGLDVLISNIFIDSQAMGKISLSKTFITLFNGLLSSIGVSFSPSFVIAYANNRKKELLNSLFQSIHIISFMLNIMISVLCVYGIDFYKLWVPKENAYELWILSVIGIAGTAVECCVSTVYDIFVTYNKIKLNAISTVVQGILNIVFVFILLSATDLGIYAIAGTSSVLTILRVFIIVIPYAAYLLEIGCWKLYFCVLKSLSVLMIEIIIAVLMHKLWICDSWFSLICSIGLTCILLFLFAVRFYLSCEDRRKLVSVLKKHKT